MSWGHFRVEPLPEPQWRQCPITGEWLVISTDRLGRPNDTGEDPGTDLPPPAFCPFCPGSEFDTPDEIAALRPSDSLPNGSGWTLRVVPNSYPAVRPVPFVRRATANENGFFSAFAGSGEHELFIESNRHVIDQADLTTDEIADLWRMYRARLRHHQSAGKYPYPVLFKNCGAAAGASVQHTHSQLVLQPFPLPRMSAEWTAALEYHARTGHDLFRDYLADECTQQERILINGKHMIALAPFASRYSFEMWLFPKESAAHFPTATDEMIVETAEMLRTCLRKLSRGLGHPAYNYVLHTAPLSAPLDAPYRWHIEILPRLNGLAGYECGSGAAVNPVPPEQAARFLRDFRVEP